MHVAYVPFGVCLRCNQFTQLSFMQYVGLYIINWPIQPIDDRQDKSVLHLIIIIVSEGSTFPIIVIFSEILCLR